MMSDINMRKLITRIGTRRKIAICFAMCALIVYRFALPEVIFEDPYSTVLVARDGELLSATIASDGQWRFPENQQVPRKFAAALIAFEDQRFYWHPGVDPLALTRAFVQNVSHRKTVSGGSTISMQVVRLSRRSASRTLLEKSIEIILASRLEWSYSKKEILSLYASHAPFGGNVVGIEAACWRYFGRGSENLSWAEAALLAVLPNAPSLIHPGRNSNILQRKRDRLLDKLYHNGDMDSISWQLSKREPIPDKPKPLPRHARHLLTRVNQDGYGQRRLVSTLDYTLQHRVEDKLQQHHHRLKSNQIWNGAVLVLDVRTGNTLAYVGNVYGEGSGRGEEVDIITAHRSTGSILKPFLFAAALDEGSILPGTLLPDIPVMMNGFAPKNFSQDYDGAVPADVALIRSLNVPAVFMLKDYRYEKFHTLLRNMGLTSLRQPADHYGLSLILGGAEGTLWDITGMYASLARTLNNYFEHPGKNRYRRADFHPPAYVEMQGMRSATKTEETSWLSASSVWTTFETLKELYRPVEESGWKFFNTSKTIAWKTGTSFGFRDGWALGVNGDYAVGVWIGNADGEGRSGLTGTNAAAPLMFDVFSLLPGRTWFEAPRSEMHEVAVCKKSGQRASIHCAETANVSVTLRGLGSPVCRYHKTIHVSADERFRLHATCADIPEMTDKKWFVLPPVQAHYYRSKHISYKPLPPYRSDCQVPAAVSSMDLIYPKPKAKILIPRDDQGKPGSSVFELAHRDEDASVFWHLDGNFLGETRGVHRIAINPPEGDHVLTLVDEEGQFLEEHFTVISRL